MRFSKNVFKQLTLVVAVLCLANACADYGVTEGKGQYSGMNQLIIGGDRAEAGWYNAVVSLHETTSTSVYVGPFCSGTLITDSVVLTAAHCLDVGRRTPKAMSPSGLMIYIGVSPVEAYDAGTLTYGDFLAVSETKIHPSYDNKKLVNDIALVRLAQPVPAEVATPIPALPASLGFTPDDVGGLLNFAGYGEDENQNYGVRLEVDHVLGGLGCTVAGCPSSGVAATQISYSNVVGPCFGDSGGPAFIFRDNAPYVGGITSYGDANCAVYGVSTRTDAFESWINDFAGTGSGYCGDGLCAGMAGGEDCYTCPADCAKVLSRKKVVACCGNGTCESRESASTCSVDCLP
jgi:secreted trypsin-like serine protease